MGSAICLILFAMAFSMLTLILLNIRNWSTAKTTLRKTNADKIREMTNEELAEYLKKYTCPTSPCPDYEMDCGECWLMWLNEKSEEKDRKDLRIHGRYYKTNG